MPTLALLDPAMIFKHAEYLAKQIGGVLFPGPRQCEFLAASRRRWRVSATRRSPIVPPVHSVGVSDSEFENMRRIVLDDIRQESADKTDIADDRLRFRPEQTICKKVIPWHVPETHNRMKYEKKIGKPASLIIPRLRGRELRFPDGKLISRLVVSEEDAAKLERLEMTEAAGEGVVEFVDKIPQKRIS